MKYLLALILFVFPVFAYSAQTTVNTSSDTFQTAWNRQQSMNTELYAQYATKWTSGEAYTADNQLVTHGGNIFICILNHTAGASSEPGTGGSWTTYWKYSGADRYQMLLAEGAFVDGDKTKLDGVEESADVTDATNVAAAGAVMDGDFSSNGIMERTGAGTYSIANSVDIVALFNSGTCSGYLKSDGTCDTPSGSMVYPGAGIPNSTGSAWGTSYSTTTLAAALDDETWTFTGAVDMSGASSVSVGPLQFADSDGSPSTVGVLRYDNTVTGLDDGALAWYDDDEVKYLAGYATLPTTDGEFLVYNATTDKWVPQSMSGHATMDESGDVTLQNVPVSSLTDLYSYDPIPIAWMQDGTSAPAAADDSTRAPFVYRDFDSTADEDLNFIWFVPSDVSGTTIQYRVKYLITNATGPSATEGVAFGLSGVSAGDNDASNGTKGTVVVVTDDTLNAAQWDVMITGWSGNVTVTNMAAGEVAEMALIRDVSDAVDDYGQDVGVFAVEIRYVQNPAR